MNIIKYILLLWLLNCAGDTYECARDNKAVECTYNLKQPEPAPVAPTTTVINNNNTTTIVITNVTNVTNIINITVNEFIDNYNFFIFIDNKFYSLNTSDAVVKIVNGEIILTWTLDKDCFKEHKEEKHKKKPKIKKISGDDDKPIHRESHEDHESHD